MVEILEKIEGKKNNKVYRDSRAGDVKHSLADINKAKLLIDYAPLYSFNDGLIETYNFYKNKLKSKKM